MNPRNPSSDSVSRRRFLAQVGAAALLGPSLGRAAAAGASGATGAPTTADGTASRAAAVAAPARRPIGLELYSVRGELQRDLPKTLRAVAQMGYEVVEFYAPYLGWTFPYAKEVRAQLDDLGLRCLSTHNNSPAVIDPGTMAKAIELNQILGARYLVVASPPRGVQGVEGWKRVAEQFSAGVEQLRPHGLTCGFHNHATEWKPLGEGAPHAMQVLADNTPPDFALQLDVGTAVEAGVDTVAWIRAHPGRIRSVHLKDWTPGKKEDEKAYRVLFGEGVAPWREIVAAAEEVGGVEYFLLEQEGSRFPEFETAERCLANWRAFRRAAL